MNQSWGRLVEQGGAGQYPVVFGFDPAGNRTTMTDGNNHVTRWEYDAQNRVKGKVYADGTRWEYTYDAGGNLLTRKDAKNQVTGYQYNAYGLPTVVDYASDPDVAFTYDVLGRRTGMTDGSGATTWAYDVMGRMVTNVQARAGAEMRYSFDVEGRRAQMLVDDRAVVYGYDHAGRLEVVDDDAVALGPMQYVWDAESGRMKEVLLPGGAKIGISFDSAGRLTSRSYTGRFGQALASVAYTHDKAGQRVTENGNRGSLSFDYDEKRQLIRADGVTGNGGSPQEFNYSFDPIGNWLTGDIGDAGVDEPIAKEFTANAVNQYTEIEVPGGTVMPEYDLNGNMTSDGQRLTIAWDQENRLTEVRTATTASVFIYDGLGKRVERREYATTGMGDPGTLTETARYVYDGLLPVEERIWNGPATGAAAKVRKLTRGLDLSGTLEGAGGIGGLLAFTSSGFSSFHFSDGNGNVTHLFDAGDQLKAEYKYDPFGNRMAASGPLAEENAWQWSGKEFHEGSGLVYYLFRYFSPEMGRWVSRDPQQENGGMNLFCAVRNTPISLIDPFGKRPLPVPVRFGIPEGTFDVTLREKKRFSSNVLISYSQLGGKPKGTKSACCCRGIRMAQVIFSEWDNWVASEFNPAKFELDTDEASFPWYPYSYSSRCLSSITDKPGAYRPISENHDIPLPGAWLQTFKQEAETCAVCIDDVPWMILGCRKWGHIVGGIGGQTRWGFGANLPAQPPSGVFLVYFLGLLE